MDYEYYIKLCDQIATQSKCLSRKIGSILATPDKSIISTGYNGPSRGIPHCDSKERLEWLIQEVSKIRSGSIKEYFLENKYGKICPRQIMKFKSGEGLEYCQAGHAERNAILNCVRTGTKTIGCTLFVNTSLPCSPCSIEIVNSGITRVVCLKKEKDYDIGARWILTQGEIEIIEI